MKGVSFLRGDSGGKREREEQNTHTLLDILREQNGKRADYIGARTYIDVKGSLR
jgi:hypothetical protein